MQRSSRRETHAQHRSAPHPNDSCRRTGDNGVWRDVLGNDGASTYNCPISNIAIPEEDGPKAYQAVAANPGLRQAIPCKLRYRCGGVVEGVVVPDDCYIA